MHIFTRDEPAKPHPVCFRSPVFPMLLCRIFLHSAVQQPAFNCFLLRALCAACFMFVPCSFKITSSLYQNLEFFQHFGILFKIISISYFSRFPRLFRCFPVRKARPPVLLPKLHLSFILFFSKIRPTSFCFLLYFFAILCYHGKAMKFFRAIQLITNLGLCTYFHSTATMFIRRYN